MRGKNHVDCDERRLTTSHKSCNAFILYSISLFTITAENLASSLYSLIFIVSNIGGQAPEFISYAMLLLKKKTTSVFHASVLLLTMNFVITLSK